MLRLWGGHSLGLRPPYQTNFRSSLIVWVSFCRLQIKSKAWHLEYPQISFNLISPNIFKQQYFVVVKWTLFPARFLKWWMRACVSFEPKSDSLWQQSASLVQILTHPNKKFVSRYYWDSFSAKFRNNLQNLASFPFCKSF